MPRKQRAEREQSSKLLLSQYVIDNHTNTAVFSSLQHSGLILIRMLTCIADSNAPFSLGSGHAMILWYRSRPFSMANSLTPSGLRS